MTDTKAEGEKERIKAVKYNIKDAFIFMKRIEKNMEELENILLRIGDYMED